MFGKTAFDPNQTALRDDAFKLAFTYVSLFDYSKVERVNKKCGEIIRSLYPYALFKIARVVSQKNIAEVIKFTKLANLVSDSGLIHTDCFFNMLTLSVLASGVQKTKLVANRLYTSYKLCGYLKIQVKNVLMCMELKFDNLFSGPIIVDLNNNIFKEDEDDKLRARFKLIYNNFLSCINESLLQCEYKESDDFKICKRKTSDNIYDVLDHFPYDFNQDTIHFLLNEIELNIEQVNEARSFVYCISINYPNPKRYEGKAFEYSVYHAFAIEHYFSPQKKGSRFRIYQSNIRKMSLQEYIRQKGYQLFSDEGCLDYKGIIAYFDDIKLLLKESSKDHYDELCNRCFGSFLERQRTSYYNINTQSIEGFSFRYKTESFDPKHCIKNMLEFVKEQNKDSPFFNLQEM
ncbi:MAG TPA: hypothetical protein PLC42_05835 [Parachlamydiaceae bacterium]|nr:hypothetical protein [Parachlamydiaceae bacterium]